MFADPRESGPEAFVRIATCTACSGGGNTLNNNILDVENTVAYGKLLRAIRKVGEVAKSTGSADAVPPPKHSSKLCPFM